VAISPKAWGKEFDVLVVGGASTPEPLFHEEGPYAVVQIRGPLSQRSGFFSDSYEDILKRAQAALQTEHSAVCLRLDSPGGDWCGALELARELRAMAKQSGKRLIAFTDGMALSAGYAIACAASEIVATESASVGSIGVWAPLIDVTAQDAMMGVKVAIAASGAAKAERNPHAGITDEAFARLQAQVNEQAEIFFEHVSEARGLPVSKIRALEGAELFGQRAIAAGLTDRTVNSWSEFLTSSEGTAMSTSQASKYDEAYGLLKQAAEGDDEEAAKKAKKCLKAMEEEEGDKDKDKDGDKDKEAKARADDDEAKKAAKAKADDEEAKAKKAKADEEEAKASSFNLAARLHALEAKDAAKEEKATRDALLAKRPDFSPEIRATLAKASLAQLKEAVETWPKIASKLGQAAAASQATGTRGEYQGGDDGARGSVEPAEDEYIARRMGAYGMGSGIRRSGRVLELGPMTPEQAKSFLESEQGRRAQSLVEKGTE
jgi:signal peptide peptidase SppA